MVTNEEKILQTLDHHTVRLDTIDTRLDTIDNRLEDHDQKLDKLITIAVDHGEHLSRIEETMVTKTDYRHMLGLLEGIATDMKTPKEEYSFSIKWLKWLQDQYDRQEREIQAIKLKLQMA